MDSHESNSLSKFKVAVIQATSHVGDSAIDKNLRKYKNLIDQAIQQSAQVIVLPELFNYGYDLDQQHLINEVNNQVTENFLKEISSQSQCVLVAGVVEKNENLHSLKLQNKIVVFDCGQKVTEYVKVHLFKSEPTFENKTFEEGDHIVSWKSLKYGHLGFLICYDLRFPEISRALFLEGVQVLVVSSAWGFGRREVFKTLTKARAIENQCFVLSADQVGQNENQIQLAGCSSIVDPLGQVLAEANENEETILIAEIDLNQIEQVKKFMNCKDHRREDVYAAN